ncbi:MAG: cell division protein FtsZ [Bacteroidetes bacterium]|nr:cell division protein FtsZ [Bacteroidota bacterium]
MSIVFDMPEEQSSIIKVIGVGGGGSNAVNYMYEQGIRGVNFVICNTDSQALEMSPVPNKIQLGPTLTNGRGAGAMPEVGKNATIESEEEIRDLLSINTKMVFVTAGMGGGTGTGGAPEVAKIAKDLGILTVGIITVPFDFEGKRKKEKADAGIEEMRKNVDALIVISNNKLRDIYGNLSLTEAFGNADSILSTAAKGISEIITKSGLINVDFEDVKTVMQNSGVALMGTGKASGEDRAIHAVDAAMSSPLLSDNDIHGAKGILLNITSGSEEIRMDEVTLITEYVQQAAANETEIIWGVCYDDTLESEIAVTLIATGFEGNKIKNTVEQSKPQKIVHTLNEEVAKPTAIAPTVQEKEDAPQQGYTERIVPQPEVTNDFTSMESNMSFLEDDIDQPEVDNSKEVAVVDPEEYGNDFSFTKEDEIDCDTEEEDDVFDMTASNSFSMELFSDDSKDDNNEQTTASKPNMAEVQRERMMRLKNIVSINKIKNNQSLRDMENEPAYVRKNVEFAKEQRSNESNLSKYHLEDNYEGKPEIKENNSFLHDNVD